MRLRIDILYDAESTNKCLTEPSVNLICITVSSLRESAWRQRSARQDLGIPVRPGSVPVIGLAFCHGAGVAECLVPGFRSSAGTGIERTGYNGDFLKWPNDLVCADKKLGGILLEARSETAASCDVVIGIGINICLTDEIKDNLDQPVTDLAGLHQNLPSRNRLAGRIIAEQLLMLNRIAAGRMGEYVAEWRDLDYLSGRQVELLMPGQVLQGRVGGVDDNGQLLLETPNGTEKFSSGELRVRTTGEITCRYR